MVPKTWVKFIVGLFLLPVAWVLTKSFGETLVSALQHGLLGTKAFLFFLGGIVLWGLAFFVLPRSALLLSYVYGHEITHAIWVKLFGGKVAERFYVSLKGGHILTDRVNTWIALAPYFFPIYSALILSIYGVAKLFTEVSAFQWVMCLLFGFTLAFHLTFTCILIAQGQPDLHYGGTFFSMMVIYVINLLILTALLLATAPHESMKDFGERLFINLEQFVEWVNWFLREGSLLLERLWKKGRHQLS